MFDVKPVTSEKPFDCGPTCLKMLLAYYGVEVDLDTLTEECALNLSGTTATTLMDVGRDHGLDMQCFSMDADELVAQDRPAIVHWKFGHWVMFAGTDRDGRVSICNPDMGRYRMSAETFATYFTGLESHPDQGVAIFNGDPRDLVATAPDNIAAGTVFEVGGTYYRALAAIARGEAITGVNAAPTSVADEINAINESEE